eukprot:scaffold6265_cov120-Skeletonema_marinoi.AAC.12
MGDDMHEGTDGKEAIVPGECNDDGKIKDGLCLGECAKVPSRATRWICTNTNRWRSSLCENRGTYREQENSEMQL